MARTVLRSESAMFVDIKANSSILVIRRMNELSASLAHPLGLIHIDPTESQTQLKKLAIDVWIRVGFADPG